MRALLLLWLLLAIGDSKPYEPIDAMDYMRNYDTMMADRPASRRGLDRPASRWGDDDNDIDDDDDDDDEDCPTGCQCFPHVVQCSDKGLISIPEKIPEDTRMIDLQNNDITDIKENDFKGLKDLYALFLINNKLSSIHPKAFKDLGRLRLLYLSYNLLTQVPANLPPNILELRFHENRISRVQKEAFKGLRSLNVLELGANPLANSGIELGAFDGVATLYLGISEAKLTAIPKDLPSSMTELQLDYNKISKVEIEDFKRFKNLQRLSLGFNQIKTVENGSLASIPNVREVHLENNKLKKVPPGLSSLRYLQVMFLHGNKINYVGVNDFCPSRDSDKKSQYSSISLFANPVRYWNIPPTTFRCVAGSRGVQLASNFRRK